MTRLALFARPVGLIAGLILAGCSRHESPPTPSAPIAAAPVSDAGATAPIADAGTATPVEVAATKVPRVITGPSGNVTAVSWSPDGSHLAETGLDRLVRVYDGETGLLQQVLEGPAQSGRALLWSPDGKLFVVSDNAGTVFAWQSDGTAAWTTHLPAHVVATSFAFPGDGKALIAGCTDGAIRTLDAGTGKIGRVLSAGKSPITSVTWSRDGKYIASVDPVLRLWLAETGKQLPALAIPPQKPTIFSLAFAPDSRVLAGGSTAGQVEFWSVLDGKDIARIDAHTDRITALSYSNSGEALVTASDDHRIRLWNMNTGEIGTEFAGHADTVTAVEITRNGKRVASASNDGSVRVWDATSGAMRQRLAGPRVPVVAIAQLPGQRTAVTLTVEGDIAAWDLSTGNGRWQRRAHEGSGRALAVVPDGRYVITSGGLQKSGGLPGDPLDEERVPGVRADIKLWDPSNGIPVRDLGGHAGLITALALSGNGRTMVTSADEGKAGDILIWDMAASATKARVGGNLPPIRALAFASNLAVFASGGSDGTVQLIDPVTTVTSKSLKADGPIEGLAISADGTMVATGVEAKDGSSLVQLWDVATGKVTRTLSGQRGRITRLTFSPDGWYLLSTTVGSDGDAHVWVVQSGDVQGVAPGAAFGGYTAADFTPDVRNIALAGQDGAIRLWSAR